MPSKQNETGEDVRQDEEDSMQCLKELAAVQQRYKLLDFHGNSRKKKKAIQLALWRN